LSIGINPNKNRLFEFQTHDAFYVNFLSLMEHYGANMRVKATFNSTSISGQCEVSHPDVPVVLRNYKGSVTQHAKELGATHLVRGLRQASDFNDEFSLTGIVGHIDSDLIMTHFICNEKFLHISSSTARELASLGEDISWLVTPKVEEALKGKFKNGR
jgi:pantetheine-phosphate adenylyltransferase